MNVYETKRYEPDFSYESGLPGMFETSKGGYVAHGDYATLFSELEVVKAERDALERQLSMSEAKCKGYFSDAAAALVRCDALAVENVALKEIGDHLSADLNDVTEEVYPSCEQWWQIETPATSAALAAIEARGVEKAATALDALSKLSASATSQANFRASAVYLRTEVLPGIGEAK